MQHIHKSKTAKLVSGLAAFSMVLSTVGFVPASAATVEELTAQINSLLSTIASLQSQLVTLQGGSTGSYTFTKNLKMGDTETDVMNLQKVLNSDPATQVAASGTGSKGNESSYFGALTKAAVIKFQNKYASEVLTPLGLTAGTGYVGAATRAKLNTIGGGTVVVPPPTGGAGTLSVSSTVQPTASLAVSGASRIPFTKFVVTAGATDVTLNSVVVERTGLGHNAILSGVVLLDDQGMQLGVSRTLNSNNQATVGEATVIKAGTSKTFTVSGNTTDITTMASYAGEVIGLSVVSLNTSAAVSGSLPIAGALHTTNATLSIGSASLAVSSFDPQTAASKPVGTSDYKFAGVRVTAGSAEKVRLLSVRWNQSGSVAATDLANVKVFVDGTSYTPTVSADGKYFTANFGSGIVIDKGFSKDIYAQGDIVGTNASGRTIQFDLEKNTDLYLTGETYGYGIIGTNPNGTTNTASSNNSEFVGTAADPGTPFFSGSLVTVTAGSATSIQKSNSVPSQNIAVNVPNQVLGGFETNFTGEAVSAGTLRIAFSTSSGVTSGGAMTDITIVDQNGAVVAGPTDATLATTYGGSQHVNFTDTVTFPLGKQVYTIKGKLPSTYANNGTITASTTPGTWTTVKGVTTGSTVSLSAVAFSMNAMTIKTAALTVSVASTPVAQNIPAGIQGFTFANYQLDASASGEDVRFSSISLLPDVTTMTAGEVTGCQLWDGTTALNTGSQVVNTITDATDTTFTFDSSYTVPKGTVKTLALKCNIASSVSTGDTITWGITNAVAMTVTGVTSGANVSESVTGATGQLMTVAAGSFTVVLDGSTPGYTIISAGSNGTTLAVLKIHANNEELTLKQLELQRTSTASSTNADFVGNLVTIWDGATQVGTAVFQGSNTQATATLDVLLPKDADKLLTVKADLSPVGVSLAGTPGALIKVDYDGCAAAASCGTKALSSTAGFIGSSSTSDTAVNGLRVFKSYPTFAKQNVPVTTGALVSGTSVDLYRFSVKAASTGSIGIYQFTVNIATSASPASASSTITDLKVMAYTDSSYSSPVSGFNPAGQLNDTITTLINSGNTTVTMSASTQGQDYLQIPANATYYFRVIGTVNFANSPTSASVVTNIQGDAAYPLLYENTTSGTPTYLIQLASSTNAVAFGTHDDFIWSPNSTTTNDTDENAWTNGYYVPGLGADYMDSVTLTK